MSLENISNYMICTTTHKFNINFKNYFGYNKPDGNFYSITRGENIVIDNELKVKFEQYIDNNFNNNNNLISLLESKTNIKFEFRHLPSYSKEKPLYLLIYRNKIKENYDIVFSIGYKSIHIHYWTLYIDDIYEWVTFNSSDIIAWYKLPNEVLIKGSE